MAAEGHVEYGITIQTAAPFADTVAGVRQALKQQGFGVLTEIDVRATMRDKLGEDMEDHFILGACSPARAPGPDRRACDRAAIRRVACAF